MSRVLSIQAALRSPAKCPKRRINGKQSRKPRSMDTNETPAGAGPFAFRAWRGGQSRCDRTHPFILLYVRVKCRTCQPAIWGMAACRARGLLRVDQLHGTSASLPPPVLLGCASLVVTNALKMVELDGGVKCDEAKHTRGMG